MSELLITHVDVLTDEGVLKNHAIAINNGYITAILNDSEAEKVKVSAKEVLDGKGQLATPGTAHNSVLLKCCALVPLHLATCISL